MEVTHTQAQHAPSCTAAEGSAQREPFARVCQLRRKPWWCRVNALRGMKITVFYCYLILYYYLLLYHCLLLYFLSPPRFRSPRGRPPNPPMPPPETASAGMHSASPSSSKANI